MADDVIWGKERVAELKRRYGKEGGPARVRTPAGGRPAAPPGLAVLRPAAQPPPSSGAGGAQPPAQSPAHSDGQLRGPVHGQAPNRTHKQTRGPAQDQTYGPVPGRLMYTPELASDRPSPQAGASADLARAGQMLENARWAARAYGTFGARDVERIVHAVAQAAADHAHEFAEDAVRETGFGVVEHKVIKNLACSTGLLQEYAGHDYVTPQVDEANKIVRIPRPAGVVLALTPSTNPVATTYFKTLLALMTRNSVLICPHPMAAQVSAKAVSVMAQAAQDAGAPAGIVQCVPRPTIDLVESLMGDERVGTIVATGGVGVVRAAYSSSNPALGVGPGNVPCLVDDTADVRAAAEHIVASKAFDNSVLCTNESVLIATEGVADALLRELTRHGAHLLTPEEVGLLTAHMFPMGRLNSEVVGRDAGTIAHAAGVRTGPATRLLLAPFDAPLPEQMMAHEKLCPVLGVLRVPDAARGISAARAIVRIAGSGHSAAIHSADPETIMNFGAAVPVLRIAVNVGNSTGSSGIDTNLAPTMTIGTGFVGRSAIGENLAPKHLLNWAHVAYNSDDAVPMAPFAGLSPWPDRQRDVPTYPWPSNDPRFARGSAPGVPAGARRDAVIERVTASLTGATSSGSPVDDAALREHIRRLVADELSTIGRG